MGLPKKMLSSWARRLIDIIKHEAFKQGLKIFDLVMLSPLLANRSANVARSPNVLLLRLET